MASIQTQEERVVVVLGTGGTIAGTAASSADHVGYTSAQRGVQALLGAVPPLAAWPIECEQVAQLDSKDMSHGVWLQLAQRVAAQLARPGVCGVVVTHGTDTLEETAYFLHRVLDTPKPVVLTAAMRPATALQADGPQNLLDAVTVAREPGARGVLAVLAGQVWAGAEVRKVHTYRLNAFCAGDAGALAVVEQGRVRRFRAWPGELDTNAAAALQALLQGTAAWPWVEIVTSHAGAGAAVVALLHAAGVEGIVVAGTGNGTVHHTLEAALLRAQAGGLAVLRVSRCALGGVVEGANLALPAAYGLTPPQARIELMLRLLAARATVSA